MLFPTAAASIYIPTCSFFKKKSLNPLPEIGVHTALSVLVCFWLCWVFRAARGLSALVAESRGHSGGAVLRLLAAGEPRLREHGLQ